MTHTLAATVALSLLAADAPQPFAVVELFTSQGCSSCPPADRVLSWIDKTARKRQLTVYALSFHVDYWDDIGWKDPFSAKAFTQRQSTYAQTLGLPNIYTPQMIINGRAEFVGHDSQLASRTINDELRRPPVIGITASSPTIDDHGIAAVDYALTGNTQHVTLLAALAERALDTDVKAGENRGRKLRHDCVVRAFAASALKKDQQRGTIRLAVPDDVDRDNASIVLYAQHDETWHIIGAARVPLQVPSPSQGEG